MRITVRFNSQIEVGGDNIAYSDIFNDISNTQEHDILALAETSSNLSTFVRLVKAANLETALQGEGPFTLFAPTNEAFANLPTGTLEHLMKTENRGELIQVLQAHVLPAKVLAAQFNNSQRIATSDNKQIIVDVATNTNDVTIGGASILRSNVEASNGVLHVVDGIITPTDVAPDGVR